MMNEYVDYSRCPWCRRSHHDATVIVRHVRARQLTGKCDPNDLRRSVLTLAEFRAKRENLARSA